MRTEPSHVRHSTDASTASPSAESEGLPKIVIPSVIPPRAAPSGGLFSRLVARRSRPGLGDMPAEIVDHVASFLPPSDTLRLAATSTSTRSAIEMRTLSAALTKQAAQRKSVKDLDHFMALFEQISTLPPRLQQRPLTALAKGMSIHVPYRSQADWGGARRVLLQACDRLPPEFRAAPLIALAGTIRINESDEKQQTSFDYVLNLITDLPPRSQAAVLCALAGADPKLPRNRKAFSGILNAAKDLPRNLRDQVLDRLDLQLMNFVK